MGLPLLRLAVAGALLSSCIVSGCTGDIASSTQPQPQTTAPAAPPPGDDDQTALSPATPSGVSIVSGNRVELYSVAGDATSADSASNHGGPTIPNVHLQIIFWGADWSTEKTTATSASMADILTSVQRIISQTPYLSQMGQYGFQSIDIRGHQQVTSSEPPFPTFTYTDVFAMIQGQIDAGTYPEPDETNGDNLYIVFTPRTSNYTEGDAGPQPNSAHGDWEHDDVGDQDIGYYALVKFGSLDAITESFTHELVESIANPTNQRSPAWLMEKNFGNDNEIGDACAQTVDRIDGILVQAYFSQSLHSCVIPMQPSPTITSISPNQGPENGGQKVTITGTGFDPWSGTTVFYFGDQAATNVSCTTSTQCTATTPAGWGVASVFADVNHGQSSGTPTYLFGPGAPSCTASYACQHNGSGATTISCGSVQNMTLWKWNGAPNVNSFQQDTNATINIDEWVDPTSPATPGTPLTFMVTLTTSLGTSDSNEMTVDSINCACTTRAVCELANGTQIYPQPNSPPNWCTLRGGHYANKYICP
jgi:hypothetical protein